MGELSAVRSIPPGPAAECSVDGDAECGDANVTIAHRLHPSSLSARMEVVLDFLSSHHGVLFTLLLVLNAGTRFYAGVIDDAAVYSLQVMNRATGGLFSDDLFLRYGSQDRFSIISSIAGPLAAILGPQLSFFLLYLLSIALLLWAALRLLLAVIPDTRIAAAGAIFVSVAPLVFGGLGMFQVSEPFFTPRLPACALTLLGLESVARSRPAIALLPLAGAALLHPVMALPGIVVWAANLLLRYLRPWIVVLVAVCGVVLALVALGRESLVGISLPVLDDEWRSAIRAAGPYNFIEDWTARDWLDSVGGLVIVAAAAVSMRRAHPPVFRLLVSTLLVAVGGLALTAVASRSTAGLIFQAQPYRALWLIAFLNGPLGLWLAARAYASPTPTTRLWAPVILCYLARSRLFPLEAAIGVCALGVFTTVGVAARRRPLPEVIAKAVWQGAAITLVVASVAVPAGLIVMADRMIDQLGLMAYVRALAAGPGPVALALLAIVVVAPTATSLKSRRLAPIVLMAAFLVVQAAAFAVPLSAAYQRRFDRDAADVAFVKNAPGLTNAGSRTLPTVYADFIPPQTLWLDLRVKNYFQTTGVIFSSQQAREASRRASLVAPFELYRASQPGRLISINDRLRLRRLFGPPNATPPSTRDLLALCDDPVLDFAVIRGPRLAAGSVTNGNIHIYDCAELRDETRHAHTSPQITDIEASL